MPIRGAGHPTVIVALLASPCCRFFNVAPKPMTAASGNNRRQVDCQIRISLVGSIFIDKRAVAPEWWHEFAVPGEKQIRSRQDQ